MWYYEKKLFIRTAFKHSFLTLVCIVPREIAANTGKVWNVHGVVDGAKTSTQKTIDLKARDTIGSYSKYLLAYKLTW